MNIVKRLRQLGKARRALAWQATLARLTREIVAREMKTPRPEG